MCYVDISGIMFIFIWMDLVDICVVWGLFTS